MKNKSRVSHRVATPLAFFFVLLGFVLALLPFSARGQQATEPPATKAAPKSVAGKSTDDRRVEQLLERVDSLKKQLEELRGTGGSDSRANSAVASQPATDATNASPAMTRYVPSAEEIRRAYQRAGGPRGQQAGRAYKLTIEPHWFADNSRLWYRNDLSGGTKEFIVVDAERGTRQPAFDHEKLAAGLSKAADTKHQADRLPFAAIEFVDDAKAVRFKVGETTWKCDLASYECSKVEPDASSIPDSTPEPSTSDRDSVAGGLFGDDSLLDDPLWNDGTPSEAQEQTQRTQQGQRAPTRGPVQDRDRQQREPRSPDGKWTAFVRDNNVFVRGEDKADIQLSQDGQEGNSYGMLAWSADSQRLAAFRIEPGDRKEVYLIESSPRDGGRAQLRTRPYDLPGDKFAAHELNLFQVGQSFQPDVPKDQPAKTESQERQAGKPDLPAAGWKQFKPEVERVDFGTPRIRWNKDGRHFTYQKVDRGHQQFRLIEVDSHDGTSRTIIDEKSDTFIWTAHTEGQNFSRVNWLDATGEIIYVSEQDGWRHLYLIDAAPSPPTPLPASGERGKSLLLPLPASGERGRGEGQKHITKGEWVVRGVDRIDEENRQVWFRASGRNADQDPYFVHFYRVNFDGTGLVALTEGNGNHTIQFSPDRKYIIDTNSRADTPPVHELRRVADGRPVCELERASVTELESSGWRTPEVFVAKGRDGKTDIWGLVSWPRNFDKAKKYPVIESIYAGPHGSFVPKSFSPANRFASLNDLGFIVVQIDGMGTSNRSKAFHDVCWHNLKDAGFPDRIGWMKALAEKYPQVDTDRVGVYGTSAGGQSATGALMFHGDFYKAAVSACGCHDNRMDKASWNEQWMGYPVGPHYADNSNITHAGNLCGKLLLVVGELDTNVPPESTFRLADALIKAGKDFEYLVVPGMGHSNGGAYGTRRLRDFFVRHLHGVEPPDHNDTRATATAAPATPDSANRSTESGAARGTERATREPAAMRLDLRALNAEFSAFRPVAQLFEADRGSLNRVYATPGSPTRHSRLRQFYSAWLTALQPLNRDDLSDRGRGEYDKLKESVERELRQLDQQAKDGVEVAHLIPFAATVIELDEARRKAQSINSVAAAHTLTALAKQVDQTRKSIATTLESEGQSDQKPNPALAGRAAQSVASLRTTLKNWFNFYNGYDPVFTWWMAEPYKESDAALERYAAFLRDDVAKATRGDTQAEGTEKAAEKTTQPESTKARSASEGSIAGTRLGVGEKDTDPRSRVGLVSATHGPSDVPDLPEMIAAPRSAMRGVIEKYQTDRRGPGRGGPATGQADPRERTKTFNADWLAALEQLDFDSLSRDERVDYILLKNQLNHDLRRAELPSAARGERRGQAQGREDAIVGRPIGRDELLSELAFEMIPYSPEELIEIAGREYAWCEAELKKASRDMGFGDDWKQAVEKVKTLHVEPGKQPELIRDLAIEAIDYVEQHELVTVPPLARESWRMQMMSPERQRVNPFFTGGEVISVSFPTSTMPHEAKLQSMRGNNIPFARATVFHELIPGHHLQAFMNARSKSHRGQFGTSFWTEGWALYWEFLLWDRGFARTPEERVGMLFWRMHRCARIVFSLKFHLGEMTPEQCIDYLVDRVGHERDNATAEVRRSFAGGYGPLYQAAYMLGGLQFYALHRELVGSGRMTERQFHDAILRENRIPVELVRAILTDQPLTRDFRSSWKFYRPLAGAAE